MTIEQAIVEKLRMLPPDKQQEALDFVEFLQTKVRNQATLEPELEQKVSVLQVQPVSNSYPLRGTVIRYDEPFEPAALLDDWEALK